MLKLLRRLFEHKEKVTGGQRKLFEEGATWDFILFTKYFEGNPTRSVWQALDLSRTIKVNDYKILVRKYKGSLQNI